MSKLSFLLLLTSGFFIFLPLDSGKGNTPGYKCEEKRRMDNICAKKICDSYYKKAYNSVGKFNLDVNFPSVAYFHRSEIYLGKCLGKGGFGCVFSVVGFKLKFNESEEKRLQIKKENDCGRKFAIKFLNLEKTKTPKAYAICARELANEAVRLGKFSHPHIVDLYGLSISGTRGFRNQGGFFLILEHFDEVLSDRIKTWSREACLFRDRLQIALDIASAVNYLHGLRIVYRDLKPQNCGITPEGRVKIFDFGTAVELEHDFGFYRLPAAGTPRYLPPEVIRNEKVGLISDIYSFGLILWQICKLEQPFDDLTETSQIYSDVKDGIRPTIPEDWHHLLRHLIDNCWDDNVNIRPMIAEVEQTLKDLILLYKEGEETDIDSPGHARGSYCYNSRWS